MFAGSTNNQAAEGPVWGGLARFRRLDDRSLRNERAARQETSADSVSRRKELARVAVAENEAAVLNLSEAARFSLQVRSRTRLTVDDNGQHRLSTNTRLRFRYDLVNSEGERIQLKVQAKIQQALIQGEEGDTVLRNRIRLQFSLAGQSVQEGLQPLLNSPTAGTAEATAEGLGSFLQTVSSLAEQFATEQTLDADSLVSEAVSAFNALVDGLSSVLGLSQGSEPLPAAGSESGPALDSPAEVQPAVADQVTPDVPPIKVSPAEPSPVGAEPAGESKRGEGDEPAGEALPQPAEPPTIKDPAPVGESSEARELVNPGQLNSSSTSSEVEPRADTTRRVLQDVRLRFVKSLTETIRVLSPPGEPDAASLAYQSRSFESLSLRVRW